MIDFTQGNLLEAGAQALVNTVNTVGISGKGIALMFRDAYPDNFRAYAAACKAGHVEPGGLFITERQDMLGPRWIINFATKQHWRAPSKLAWIERGLIALRHEIGVRGIQSIAIPPLGAGNGGLDWDDVRPLIDAALHDLNCAVTVFEPTAVYQNVVKRRGVERLTPARALLAELIGRYEVLGFECSILEAQKLTWFLGRSIGRARLQSPFADDFTAHQYGPYSEKTRHLLDSLDGSYLACDRRIADAGPLEPLRFQHDRQDTITAYLTTPDAKPFRPALDEASAIIEGFQSPYGLELLATIDWLHDRVGTPLETDAMMAAIGAWPGPIGSAERKVNAFRRAHVVIAVDHLNAFEQAA